MTSAGVQQQKRFLPHFSARHLLTSPPPFLHYHSEPSSSHRLHPAVYCFTNISCEGQRFAFFCWRVGVDQCTAWAHHPATPLSRRHARRPSHRRLQQRMCASSASTPSAQRGHPAPAQIWWCMSGVSHVGSYKRQGRGKLASKHSIARDVLHVIGGAPCHCARIGVRRALMHA